MLVLLKRDFFGPDSVLYPKSRSLTADPKDMQPTPVPNVLKKFLPDDAVIVSEELHEPAPVVHKRESYMTFLKGRANPADTLKSADEMRAQADAQIPVMAPADDELNKRRAQFAQQLAAEQRTKTQAKPPKK